MGAATSECSCGAVMAEATSCNACLEPERYEDHSCFGICDDCRARPCAYCGEVHAHDPATCATWWAIRRSNTPGGLIGDPEPNGPGYHPAVPLPGGYYD